MGGFWILSVHLICGVAFIICGVLRTGGIVSMMQQRSFSVKGFAESQALSGRCRKQLGL
jgi:hypothetical protein